MDIKVIACKLQTDRVIENSYFEFDLSIDDVIYVHRYAELFIVI
jgi:hypothetical protein